MDEGPRPTAGSRRDGRRDPPALQVSRLPSPGDLGGSGDGEGGDGGDGEDGDGGAPDGPTVTCPACGVENDPEFRYCRDCVAELPGSDRLGSVEGGDGAGLL